jgi:uncharacterized FlaG/YvyC family protein
MVNIWISALKEFNSKKGMWCLPKKGSAEHTKVMKIMDRMKKGVTNLGKEGQKRIEESTRTKPSISREMEVKKTRKLRKAPVETQAKVLKPGECQYCGKIYKNLKQHITKAHLHFSIVINRRGEEPTITVTDQDGKVLVKNVPPDSEGDDNGKITWEFYFESKSGEGNQVILTEDGEVTVNRDVYNETTGRISSVTKAFKNWSVKFVS